MPFLFKEFNKYTCEKCNTGLFFLALPLLSTISLSLMTYKNLTTQEVEEKIKQLKERVELLEGIVDEIQDLASKVHLLTQKNKYITTLDFLRIELQNRTGLSPEI